MLAINSFIAKVSVQLINLFETADDQPLEIKFRRDARIEIDVERVVMRLERPRRRAGCQRRQHRRFDFYKVAVVQETANLAHDFVTQFEYFTRRKIVRVSRFQFQAAGDQIGVALALANFRIVYAVHLVRHW